MILIGIQTALISLLKQVVGVCTAACNDIIGEFQISFLTGQGIETDKRLQNRAGVQTIPVGGGSVDLDFALISRTDTLDDIVGVTHHEADDLLCKRLILADFEEILQAEQDILSAPQIPAVELLFLTVGGNTAACFLYGHQIADGGNHGIIKSLIFGAGIMVLNMVAKPMFPAILQSPINCGVIAMLGGLVIVPVVSLFTKSPDKDTVENAFECYNRKVTVSAKESLGE